MRKYILLALLLALPAYAGIQLAANLITMGDADSPTIWEGFTISRTGGSNLTGTNSRAAALTFKDASNPTYTGMISAYRRDANNDYQTGMDFWITGSQAVLHTDLTKAMRIDHVGQVVSYFGVTLATSTAKPTCDSSRRGNLWNVQGAADAADEVQMCMKKADNSYAWIVVKNAG